MWEGGLAEYARARARPYIVRMRTPQIDGMGHATFSTTVPVSQSWNAVILAKSPFIFLSACFTKAVGIAHKLHRCL